MSPLIVMLFFLAVFEGEAYRKQCGRWRSIGAGMMARSPSASGTSGRRRVRKPDESTEYREYQYINFDKTDPETRVKIGGDRVMLPGDYVVHEKYGIGRYIGVRNIDLTPARDKQTLQPVVIIKYKDSEVTFFKRTVRNELWIYRNSDAEFQELSTVLDTRSWRRRRSAAEKDAKKTGINLVRMMAIRNGFHRTPCVDTSKLSSYKEFEKNFKFTPTADQLVCFEAIAEDMTNNTRPMDRLVCGDVGFGKTEVAMRAMYRAVLSNRQVAVLVPTRVLALQHVRVIRARMPDANVELLRGGGRGKEVKSRLADGSCQIVVGTHALLQKGVSFDNLGLLIIDEEQRFGVDQKEKLKAASSGVDVLTLSATPIPRTLQLSLSGLRDFSLVMTPPKGRKEVTVGVGVIDDQVMIRAIAKEIERDGQIFVVVPFVANVSTIASHLKNLMPNITCVQAHGRHIDLEERIDIFSSGQANILVATTVVENGIDMPNVNTIIVIDADRFGMSTLYQLRGRVGRSTRQAYAYFMTRKDKILTRESEARLMYLRTFTAMGSGYDLAKRDMEMRGAGQVFGASQSGCRDVGSDFQSRILELAIEEIKLDVVMPCVETRVRLHNRFEREWGGTRAGTGTGTGTESIMKRGWAGAKTTEPTDTGTDTGMETDMEMEMGMEMEMPPADDPSGVSRWEARVAEYVIASAVHAHLGTEQGHYSTKRGHDSTEQGYYSTSSTFLDRGESKDEIEDNEGKDRIVLITEMLRNFLAANSQTDLRTLLKQWRSEIFSASTYDDLEEGEGEKKTSLSSSSSSSIRADNTVPVVLQELVKRSLLRIMCRRIGVYSVERIWKKRELENGNDNGDNNDYDVGSLILLKSEGISNKIWEEKLKEAVPKDLQPLVTFLAPFDEVPNSRDNHDDPLAPSQGDRGGNIILRRCFDDERGSRALAPEDMITMPVALLRLVSPLANAADRKLLDEVEAISKKGLVKKEKDSKRDPR